MKKTLYFLCRCLLLLSVSFQTEACSSSVRKTRYQIRYLDPDGKVTIWRTDKRGNIFKISQCLDDSLPITVPLSPVNPLTKLPRVIPYDPLAEILAQGELLAKEGWEIPPLIPHEIANGVRAGR
ncbi:MAG: hypothetical protein LBO73_03420 [Holosporaceae bacterium]|jgi:hypothetical protein|nr:hypothetical protein [Holosporaceae bacterium]